MSTACITFPLHPEKTVERRELRRERGEQFSLHEQHGEKEKKERNKETRC
jgi:hypothetical protein